MSLGPSKWEAGRSFQTTVASQFGYFATSIPHTGQRSLGPGTGGAAAC